jgi:hypothetical protein
MPEATFAHAIGRYVSDNGVHNWPEDEVSANGARDVGVELFDWVEFNNNWFGSSGPLEFTYSAALGNGDAIGELNRDDNFRQYYWLSIAKLFDDTRGPRRHDMMLYGWYQRGDIKFNNDINNDGLPDNLPVPAGGNVNPGNLQTNGVNPGQCGGATGAGQEFACLSPGNRVFKNGNEKDELQKYWGFGIEYFDKPFASLGQMRFEGEWQRQKGLTFDGPQSPSAAVNDNVGGFDSILYDPDGKNTGWHIDVGYDLQQHLPWNKRTTLNLRYDELHRNQGNEVREVEFKTWTLTGEYFFHKKARATLSYQWRDFNADDRTGNFRTNGNAVLEQVDNRIGLQVTFIYKNVLLR